MPYAASMCAFLGVLFAYAQGDGSTVVFDTDARKVLFPPHAYWLYRRSHGADTSFTSNQHCVQLEYIQYNDTFDMVTLDARNHTKKDNWEPKMYRASVKESHEDILQYTPDEGEVETATVEYRVWHVVQNACYVVEKMPSAGGISARSNEKILKCELWVKKEKEVRHQRPSYSVESEEACSEAVKLLCSPLELVYFQRLCDPILP
uniref:Putative secreted protein n=1 Tax=Amblyomma triste TaxID=251400 RepID=A0A023GAR1_AMBTT